MGRENAVALVRQLLDGRISGEVEVDQALEKLTRGLGCPHISDYIFMNFDAELTAERVVDRALAYRPIAL
ncbi:e9imm peptide [Streptomyces zhihengii]|uniref:e9imm peptide n=1 Tax=Streptomyces zhihengii TaxID=1818004 RepID=UPI003679A054